MNINTPPGPDGHRPLGNLLRSPRTALEPERVPEPVIRRSQRAKHPLIVAGNAIFSILAVVALAAGGAVFYGKQKMEEPGPLTETKTVTISRGLGIKDISDLLAREGVIDQPAVFVGGAMLLKLRGEGLKFGEYEFQKQASLGDVLDTISEGKIVQHTFSVPEGLTSEQIVARLLESDLLTGNIKEIPREGTLLPETYKINRGTPRDQIIQRMQQAHRRVLQEVWERRSPDLPVKTPEQLVILASIIEKETGRADERSRVASVFVNRLKNRMRLQSDPTIIYGLFGGKGKPADRPIYQSDIDKPTPYNTYTINGLPPTPIANPGRAALEAVANPSKTDDLYFVADGTGGHVFAATLDEHNENVARYRAFQKKQAEDAAKVGTQQPATGTDGAAPAQ